MDAHHSQKERIDRLLHGRLAVCRTEASTKCALEHDGEASMRVIDARRKTYGGAEENRKDPNRRKCDKGEYAVHMKTYLQRVATEITGRALPSFDSPGALESWRKQRQRQFLEMMGLDRYLDAPRTPLNVNVTGTIRCDGFRIDKLSYESLPGLYVAAHLYVPDRLERPAPGILYLCGHHPKQKIHYQDHPRHFAKLGFVALAVDTIQLGEVQGMHHGTYAHGLFNWISKGYTPTAAETWNAIRGLDLLEGLDEVDGGRLGVTGHSGGGSISWWTTCADDRIKAMASSSGTGHMASHIRDRTLDQHCDCNFPNNSSGWSLIEMHALAAPRPVLIVAPDRDAVFRIDSVRYVYERLRDVYRDAGAEEFLQLLAFRAPHMYTPESRKTIFSWFLTHLAGTPTTPEEAEDIDGVRLPEESLLVFGGNPPAHDRSLTVQDWFIPAPTPVRPDTPERHEEEKRRLIRLLRRDCFAAFPGSAGPARAEPEQEYADGAGNWSRRFTFDSENDLRLWGELRGNSGQAVEKSPVAVCLRTPGDSKGMASWNVLKGLSPNKWLRARLDPRGTGDTAWGAELNWHIRRAAAATGRTIASMRVWDALRGLAAIRSLPEVDADRIVLAGKGDMAVVALYAALLDGRVAAVVLEDAPKTLDIPGEPDGSGPANELISALRHADLPQVAAMLWPAKLIFVRSSPDAASGYEWTADVYRSLGTPEHIMEADDLSGL